MLFELVQCLVRDLVPSFFSVEQLDADEEDAKRRRMMPPTMLRYWIAAAVIRIVALLLFSFWPLDEVVVPGLLELAFWGWFLYCHYTGNFVTSLVHSMLVHYLLKLESYWTTRDQIVENMFVGGGMVVILLLSCLNVSDTIEVLILLYPCYCSLRSTASFSTSGSFDPSQDIDNVETPAVHWPGPEEPKEARFWTAYWVQAAFLCAAFNFGEGLLSAMWAGAVVPLQLCKIGYLWAHWNPRNMVQLQNYLQVIEPGLGRVKELWMFCHVTALRTRTE